MNAARQLVESENRLQLLLEAVTDYAIYMMDPDGCVLTWNPAAERIKGYSRQEIQGQPFRRFFTAEDQAAGVPEAILQRARVEGRVESEGWRMRKDGTRFWAHATVHVVRSESGEMIGFAKITRDMTEKRAAQEALIESERRFRHLVESVVDYAIYMLDVNGVVTNWNRGAERIKGYGSDEIVGRHFSAFYTPEDRKAGVPARALETALHEGRFEAEGWRLRKDGTRFWASVVIDAIHDDEGRHIGYAKITRDITEKRAAQQRLEENERQNVGAEHIKGYTAEEIIGRHISTFYTEPDRAAGMPLNALRTAAEQGRYEAEAWRVRKDGTLFFASVVLDAIRDEDGHLVGFAKITRDITERRNAEIELQKAHDRLTQAQKMEALGQLTGGVAHDFNNLLMVVSGHGELLRRRVGDDERAGRALDAIEIATKRGRDLTRHLLTFARRQRLNPAALSLSERAAGLRELLSASVGSSVRVIVEFPADLWPVEVDAGELELALLNMAVNARDAMPNGGVLSVTAENAALEGDGDAGLTGEFVALTVQDTGQGIAPDVLPRIFEPFFTTKDVNKGTGLGLSQVFGFVEQTGGRAIARSELGRGTSITLYLPRAASEPAAADAPEAFAGATGKFVLLVEDNPDVAEVTVRLLEQLDNRVRVATSAEAALAALTEGEPPDLVFSDIVMAGEMDGLDLARRLRAERPDLPILLATGYSQEAERIGNEFPILSKPYELAELHRAIGRALHRDSTVVPLDPARRKNGKKG